MIVTPEDSSVTPGIAGRVWRMMNPRKAEKVNPLRIGILGGASIAPLVMVKPAMDMHEVEIVAIASRDLKKAQSFAKKHKIGRSYGSYEELINDPNIDAVYIPLPNGLHFQYAKKSLMAGKHVLVEKPCTSNEEQANELFRLAESRNLVLLEGLHYRHHPLLLRLKQLIENGEIGRVKHAHATATFPNIFGKDNIRWDLNLAGGTTMDSGCYALSLLRFIMDSEPISVTSAKASLLKEGIDNAIEATLVFPEGRTGSISCSYTESYFRPGKSVPTVTIEGERGTVTISNWMIPTIWHSLKIFKLRDNGEGYTETEKRYGDGTSTYRYQLEDFEKKIRGKTPNAWVDPLDSVNNMKAIDMVLQAAGLPLRQ